MKADELKRSAAKAGGGLKRFDVFASNDCGEDCDCTVRTVEDSDGTFCYASHVEAQAARLRRQVTELQVHNLQLRQQLDDELRRRSFA